MARSDILFLLAGVAIVFFASGAISQPAQYVGPRAPPECQGFSCGKSTVICVANSTCWNENTCGGINGICIQRFNNRTRQNVWCGYEAVIPGFPCFNQRNCTLGNQGTCVRPGVCLTRVPSFLGACEGAVLGGRKLQGAATDLSNGRRMLAGAHKDN